MGVNALLKMILAISSLFVCLEFVGRHPGLLLVLIGVAGEIFCDWKEMGVGRLARAKRISAILLVAGLMMEFWEAAKSDNEIAKTNLEAKQAGKDATDAKLLITEIGTTNAQLVASNLAVSVELGKLKQPRIITIGNEKKFILLCKDMPKIPIKIYVGTPDNETEVFAEQVRQTLDDAGFGGPGAGIIRDQTLFMTVPIGVTNFSAVDLVKNDTNMSGSIGGPIFARTFQEQIVGEIGNHLGDIGFNATWFLGNYPQYLSNGEAAIFIPPKSLTSK